MILFWQENMLEADMPPRWMWGLDVELNRHFDHIRDRRDGDADEDRAPAGPMLVNEYAKDRGRHLRND